MLGKGISVKFCDLEAFIMRKNIQSVPVRHCSRVGIIFKSLFLAVFWVSTLYAAPVSTDTARQAALNHFFQKTGRSVAVAAGGQKAALLSKGQSLYHTVNLDPGGWVIVAGDDCVYPIIGYSAKGVIDEQSAPPAFTAWMDNVRKTITQAVQNNQDPLPAVADAWDSLETVQTGSDESEASDSVLPLVQTTWNQSSPYNNDCPIDSLGPGGHVYAGCVATAMAQVMKYYNYPESGYGSHSYDHSDYGTLSADFGGTVYDFTAMPLSSSSDAVAQLMYHCGVAVDMDYSPNGSGANVSHDARDAFVYHFKYDDSIVYLVKADYTDAEWTARLKSEISSGQPVVYSGQNSSGGGHAFICDGYDDADMFHFNWGWGGYYDGYFYINSLTPADRDYSTDQYGLFNIKPEVFQYQYPYAQGFETGFPDGWVSSGDRVGVSNAQAWSGDSSLLVGTEDGTGYSHDSAGFKFLVPMGGRLTFQVKRGYDPAASAYNDHRAGIRNRAGDTDLHTFFDGDFNDSDWQTFSLDLSAWAGTVVQLFFEQHNGSSQYTQWMYIDEVSITGDPVFMAGDLDEDGDVDGADLAVLWLEFGRTDCSSGCSADLNNDGSVDEGDVSDFAVNFGQ